MNILITGGSGFIGRSLCKRLKQDGHQLVLLTRTPNKIAKSFKAIKCLSELNGDEKFEVVINLAGEPIADKNWSQAQKQIITQSRLEITQTLVNYFKSVEHKPKLFISGSAIGYYGNKQAELAVDESMQGDQSFSSQLCQQWESIAMQAEQSGVRTCLLRTGIVLGHSGGALAKMLPAFKFGLGGKIGDGKQWMSWIHIEDLVGIILFCIEHESLKGPINATAPQPATNKQFSQTLGKALNRPTFISMPAFVIKTLLGEMGQALLLEGSRVLPTKILNAGFNFQYRDLEGAILNVLTPHGDN
jgi:uncharacterized protein (TIGR01777 family)